MGYHWIALALGLYGSADVSVGGADSSRPVPGQRRTLETFHLPRAVRDDDPETERQVQSITDRDLELITLALALLTLGDDGG